MLHRLLPLLAAGCATLFAQSGIRIALTGDSIINRRISVREDPAAQALIAKIRAADAAFTNLETLIHNLDVPAAAQSGGTWMVSAPWVLDELKWAGFDLFSAANNHTYDYGPEGLRSTLRELDRSGVTYAGAGINLARARAPGYLDTKSGRVALIGCASTFQVSSMAGEQRPDMPGRPGLSPLRFTTTYTLPQAAFDEIRALARSTPGSGAGGENVNFLGARFRAGAERSIRTEPHAGDLAAIAASVREARRQADWVIVSIHAHEGLPGDREKPAEFLTAFARAMIDAGADLFVGHGPHVLRGIEIYKGKPIVYSMANFIFENETIRFQPAESYEQQGLPLTATPADYYDKRTANDTRGFPVDRENWESIVAEVEFAADRSLKSITAWPITLGFGQSRQRRGQPVMAPAAEAQRILERLRKLSEPFGTQVKVQGDRATITP